MQHSTTAGTSARHPARTPTTTRSCSTTRTTMSRTSAYDGGVYRTTQQRCVLVRCAAIADRHPADEPRGVRLGYLRRRARRPRTRASSRPTGRTTGLITAAATSGGCSSSIRTTPATCSSRPAVGSSDAAPTAAARTPTRRADSSTGGRRRARNTIAASFAHVAVKPGLVQRRRRRCHGHRSVHRRERDDRRRTDPSAAIYYSSNGGSAWTNVFTLPHRATRGRVRAGSAVHASTSRLPPAGSSAAAPSGASGWTEASTAANRPAAGNITSITVDPDDANTVYVTSSDRDPHILRSTDGGAHWAACAGTIASMTLPNISLNDVVDRPRELRCAVRRRRTSACSAATTTAPRGTGRTTATASTTCHESWSRASRSTSRPTSCTPRPWARASTGRWRRASCRCQVTEVRSKFVRGRPFGIVQLRLPQRGEHVLMSRQEVVWRVLAGTEVYTVGSDRRRARVRAMPPDGANHPIWYLSTTPDDSLPNNLLSLPGF